MGSSRMKIKFYGGPEHGRFMEADGKLAIMHIPYMRDMDSSVQMAIYERLDGMLAKFVDPGVIGYEFLRLS